MPIAFATCFGGQCTLIGTTSNLVGSGLLETATGQGFKMFTTLPIICIYPFLQKYFVKGVMVGAVKG